MACNKPEALRKMVVESRGGTISPPLINSASDRTEVYSNKNNEIDILYNRIDQQVELISVLKQRLDEMTKRWERSESELETQEVDRNKVQMSCNKLTDKCSKLEVRWQQLSENHRDMITLKDEYKDKCEKLTQKLKQYEKGDSVAVNAIQRKCTKLQDTISDITNNHNETLATLNTMENRKKQLEESIQHSKQQNDKLKQQLGDEKTEHLKRLLEVEEELKQSTCTLNQSQHQKTDLQNQISDLTQQILCRGKLVHEKEDKIKELQCDKLKKENEIKKVKSELAALTDSVNNNRVVRDLRRDLLEERERYSKLEMELGRFKKAAQERLKREQSVNEELRHVTAVKHTISLSKE